MKLHPTLVLALGAAALPCSVTLADVTLPPIFSEHLVLQKAEKVPIWGKADPGEEVTVTLGSKATASTKAGPDGKWRLALDLKDSQAGPFEMTVKGKNEIKIADVVVGQVWVASGQSNMEWVLKNTNGAEQEIANSTNPMLRTFKLMKATSATPTEDFKGSWVTADPANSGNFTAVGYYFGKTLQKELQQPVGLIYTNWGGTPSEAWTSSEALDTVPDLKAAKERLWTEQATFPEKKKAFVAAYSAWLKESGREDRKTEDVAAFATGSTEGWVNVPTPGPIAGEGLPSAGAIWLRRDITVPESSANLPLRLDLGIYDAFETIYWNGKPVRSYTYETLPGKGFRRSFDIPADQVKAGANTLAVRFFAPAVFPEFKEAPKVAGVVQTTPWLAKAEFSLPTLDAEALAKAPALLATPAQPQNVASYLFNGMINPILGYSIAGVIWYQGESNAGRSYQYRTAFPLMIQDWREKWGQGVFPFYFCQLANFQAKKADPAESGWAELREAQSMTLKLPKTGQAILIDIGESGDIHPRNKKDVGERLALIALANDYGKKDVVFSGPTYKSLEIKDGKAILTFSDVAKGLVAKPLPATYDVRSLTKDTAPLVRNSPNSELEGFAICGADKKWVWADAKIDGEKVIVWSDKVPAPVAVRYGWADNPTLNLYNSAGLPASPFRTDDFPGATINGKY